MWKRLLLAAVLLTLAAIFIPQSHAQGSTTAITDAELNVRSAPSLEGALLGILPYNTPVIVEGRNSASTWAFITADGLTGWASAAWLRDFSAPLSSVPIIGADAETSGRTTVVAGENTAVVRAELNLRDAPGFGGNIITVLDPQSLVALDGRDYTSDWAQVTTVDGGLAGWVAIGWLRLPTGFVVEALPVTAEAPDYDTAAAVGDVTTTVNLPTATIANATTIAARGSALGRNRLRFIRVGDSNSVGGAFLCNFQYGRYELGEFAYLQPTIDVYRSTISLCSADVSTRNGFSSYTLLDPLWTDVNRCDVDESPLECAIRRGNPAVAVIYLGLNDMSSLRPAQFEDAMNRLIDTLISNGVIPVLNTFPISDLVVNYDPAFNAIIRSLAATRSVPLIDLEAAARALPNNGTGPDGYHLSCEVCDFTDLTQDQYVYGRALRDLLTLQMLDALRRNVLG